MPPGGYDPKYRDLAVDAAGLCAGKAQLMLKGPFEWLGDFSFRRLAHYRRAVAQACSGRSTVWQGPLAGGLLP
nr:hypothetical protein GCM10020185_52270 [Pseudomonas brassicacearum subsp. brassicacearum]